MECPNLKSIFGKKYKVEWAAERDKLSRDPWMYQIPCRAGIICPWGEDKLAICLVGHGRLAKRLEEAGCQVAQRGDSECNLTFPLSSFPAVARVVKPHRRRRLSRARRLQLAKQGREVFARSRAEKESSSAT